MKMGGKGSRWSGVKEHDISGAGEEGYAAICAGSDGIERNGSSLSDHYVVLCKVRLVGAWIKRRGVVVGARGIRSEKLREDR